jgi:phosphatidylethanolamine/phosphatidyl-N-methylethanolamine N-methyltransferase
MSAKAENLFSEEFRFLRGLIASPKGVGAIAPSGPDLSRAIAAQIPPDATSILELGAGTGVVTQALLARGFAPSIITAIEFDPDFAKAVRARCPGVNVIQGDAFDLDTTLGADATQFSAIISGIPLLNLTPPKRRALMESWLTRLPKGAPLAQFSYGLTPPTPATDTFSVTRAAFVWRNIPPARVWVYRAR